MGTLVCDELPAVDHVDGDVQLIPSDDLFSILQTWDAASAGGLGKKKRRMQQQEEPAPALVLKRHKSSAAAHMTVRKQMNDHLAVLRTLIPASFYLKRGDQASIIGGVVDYIHELQQLNKSLEAKKHRKLSRSSCCINPRRTPPPYKLICPLPLDGIAGEVSTTIKRRLVSPGEQHGVVPEVRVEFAGANKLVLKTVSQRAPGKVVKMMGVLEGRSLEILHAKISTVDDNTNVNAFTVKIGIECDVSAEELVQEIQQTLS